MRCGDERKKKKNVEKVGAIFQQEFFMEEWGRKWR